MPILIILSTIFLALCSTAILSYISMAVMIGPWIESTVVLLATLLLGIFARHLSAQARNSSITFITAGASVGGILATGCGFAFPTLYFLDPALFNSWIEKPLFFVAVMAGLSLTAGALGFLLADAWEHQLLVTDQLPFPIGELSYKMIAAQNSISKSRELAIGFFASLGYGIMQKLITLPAAFTLVAARTYQWFEFPALQFPVLELPMLWAIGFVTGHVIAMPLAVGLMTKIFITTPIQHYYFPELSTMDFLFAFASGMMVYGALMSFLDMPKFIKELIFKAKTSSRRLTWNINTPLILSWLVVGGATTLFFTYFEFSLISQLFIAVFTIACVYQLLVIGGKFGLAPMGRFATYVMLSGLLLFGFNAIQVTLVSAFVEICGGVAVDVLFGRKMAQLAEVDRTRITRLQWLGLIVSAISVGIFFWILITNLGLGSAQLLAQRGQSRALTIQMQQFNFFALIIGALFGSILKDFKVNPIMVLGGILMNTNWSLVLVLSGLSTYLVRAKEEQYPFWSGIFAANSLWMIIQGVLKF